uniref:helix-turn-helix domain-containing protein n=1 Tax=Lentilactobacillus hilgardii TaxID=1588 RepID=UPI00403FB19C
MRSSISQLGITQETLAELSGLSVNYISKIERINDQNISLKSLNAIAKVLGVEITKLLGNQEKPSKQSDVSIQEQLLLKKLRQLEPEMQKRLLKDFQDILGAFIIKD